MSQLFGDVIDALIAKRNKLNTAIEQLCELDGYSVKSTTPQIDDGPAGRETLIAEQDQITAPNEDSSTSPEPSATAAPKTIRDVLIAAVKEGPRSKESLIRRILEIRPGTNYPSILSMISSETRRGKIRCDAGQYYLNEEVKAAGTGKPSLDDDERMPWPDGYFGPRVKTGSAISGD